MKLIPGSYDALITEAFQSALATLDTELYRTEDVDPAEAVDRLSRHLADVLRRGLPWLSDETHAPRTEVVNLMLDSFATALRRTSRRSDDNAGVVDREHVAKGAVRLLKGVRATPLTPFPDQPDTPYSVGALFTGSSTQPSLESQLRREILTADRIDLLVSFVRWSGLRLILDELRTFTSRPGTQLRVITTCYMGATERRAVEELAALPNTEVRISYDVRSTRLHAKAYLFHRATGAGTAYIGSSNISKAALTTGSEWNVKISAIEQPRLWEQLEGTFESAWAERGYIPYAAGSEEDRNRLDRALRAEGEPGAANAEGLPLFELSPFQFQQEILERLDAERTVGGRHRQLVVAATGTGKTMIAAFDYKRFAERSGAGGSRPRLLFVAHRAEILKQALYSFRYVLRDLNFGEMEGGGETARDRDHLFITIQSWNSRDLSRLPAQHFEYVVVDEFHHAAAPSYQSLLDHVQPNVLLGLTATPERADGLNVMSWFDNRVSAQIRLVDAIERRLLAPFHYFGITDPVSLADLQWQRGGYLTRELEAKYITGGDMRARMIAQKFAEIVRDPRAARAIAFCVSVAHAEYMARQFTNHGIPAVAVTGETDRELRARIPEALRTREFNVVCTVDLYNEGVDIPEVDTVLFLRPTESLTVYLQQLGRGLRLHQDKECLTVLDFVGEAHRKFRFDRRYAAIAGVSSLRVRQEIERGFPRLPAGCSIELEKIAREHVLGNIDAALRTARKQWFLEEAAELNNELGRTPTLGEFLERVDIEPRDLYRRNISWARIASDAGVGPLLREPDEAALTKGLLRLSHIDAPARIEHTLSILREGRAGATEEQVALMLHLGLWGRTLKGERSRGTRDTFAALDSNPLLGAELLALLEYRRGLIDTVPPASSLPFKAPLEVHCSYSRDEILAAVGHWTSDAQPEMREGVLYLREKKTDVLFVTLDKSEKEYSPSTMYADYALGDEHFHWQSQSTTSDTSVTGQRYLNHAKNGGTILLFVRERKKTDGVTEPYSYLGRAFYESHTGSRPISIVWRLEHRLPAKLVRRTARLSLG